MNFPVTDSYLEQQRCRQWTPLISQQLRLRHLFRVTAYNIVSKEEGSYYYTLHSTTMSAPFYTSEKLESPNPKWAELEVGIVSNSAAIACVLRIWQTCENEMDSIVLTWGINFSGLIHLGSKLSDVQPTSFKSNSVILQLRGGYFTSVTTLRADLQDHLPFIDNLNVVSTADKTKVYRNIVLKFPIGDIKQSYNIEKLRRLQFLQISVRNKDLDVQAVRGKIIHQCALCYTNETESLPSSSPTRSTPVNSTQQLLTMTSLNRMLQDKPTKLQKQNIIKIRKQIEIAKFKTKLLSQEKNKKSAHIRQLKQKYTTLTDENEEKASELMENYRHLCKEMEKLREWKKEQIRHREMLLNCNQQLQQRRKQLFSQILFLYPIESTHEHLFRINGVHLPSADMLQDCPVNDVSVALGFITHVLLMCSSFLSIPLRYPVIHMGSRSIIIDHVSPSLGDTKREYPLYVRGKDRFQFNYAVCLLNKNIAQLRWLCGLNTQNLKATLPNLSSLLQGKSYRSDVSKHSHGRLGKENALSQSNDALNNNNDDVLQNGHESDSESGKQKNSGVPFSTMSYFGSLSNISDPILDTLRHECQVERSCSPSFKMTKAVVHRKVKLNETASGLSQILAIPEAFLNHQISPSSFRNYMSSYNCPHYNTESIRKPSNNTEDIQNAEAINNSSASCDISDGKCCTKTKLPILENVEQGKDLLDSSMLKCESDSVIEQRPRCSADVCCGKTKQKRRISRSVGSYTDEEKLEECRSRALGSDPLLSSTLKTLDVNELAGAGSSQQNYIKEWLQSKTEHVERKVYSEESLSSVQSIESSYSPLTLRTDALLNTTSFNLVKPKF